MVKKEEIPFWILTDLSYNIYIIIKSILKNKLTQKSIDSNKNNMNSQNIYNNNKKYKYKLMDYNCY